MTIRGSQDGKSIHCVRGLIFLSFILMCFLYAANGMTTQFHGWEHCYNEDASPLTYVHSSHLQIVRSISNRLGVQVWISITFLEPIDNAAVKLRVWQEKDGSNTKQSITDLCKFKQSKSTSNENCILENLVTGMIEVLIPEAASKFEAELQIYAETKTESGKILKDERVCIYIPFELLDSDINLFRQQRGELDASRLL